MKTNILLDVSCQNKYLLFLMSGPVKELLSILSCRVVTTSVGSKVSVSIERTSIFTALNSALVGLEICRPRMKKH